MLNLLHDMPENDYISCIVELSAMAGIFWRSFVKRFALSCGTVVCLSLLSVALVYCGQTVGWIRMPLCVEVGLGRSDIVLDGDPAPPDLTKRAHAQFSAHVYCGQTVAHLGYCYAVVFN